MPNLYVTMHETVADMDRSLHKASARPKTAKAAAANDPTVLVAAPVNGALPVPALPVPLGPTGVIGEPVAPEPDPTPEPDGEPVPVGAGAPVPVANPVEPAAPEVLP